MPRKTYTTDMTDAEWELIEPLLPAERRRGAPRQASVKPRARFSTLQKQLHLARPARRLVLS
jgi:transposase